MSFRDFLIDALDVVLGDDDLPDDAIATAVTNLACLMAGDWD